MSLNPLKHVDLFVGFANTLIPQDDSDLKIS